MKKLRADLSWRKLFLHTLLGLIFCPLAVLLLRVVFTKLAPHYPAIFGADLLALFTATIYSIAITFVVYALIVWQRTKSWATAILSVLGVLIANQFISSLIPRYWVEPDPNLTATIAAKQQELLSSVTFKDVSSSLACKIKDNIWSDKDAFRDLKVDLALELKLPGRYKITLSLLRQNQDEQLGPKTSQVKELDLNPGVQNINFQFNFGMTWGYFIPRGELQTELVIERLSSISELVDPDSLPLEYRKLEGANLRAFSYRRLLTQNIALKDVSNIRTDSAPAQINCE